MIFQLKGETVQKLLTSSFHLKDRRIFDFDRSLVNRITFKKEDVSYSFEKRDVEEWELTGTENVEGAEEFKGMILERSYKVDNVVRGLGTVEYEDFDPIQRGDANYELTGIDNPVYEIEFYFEDDTKPVSVVLTEKDEQSGKAFLSPDNGQTVYHTSGYFLTNFPESVGELFE
jgi:hypothetical protein